MLLVEVRWEVPDSETTYHLNADLLAPVNLELPNHKVVTLCTSRLSRLSVSSRSPTGPGSNSDPGVSVVVGPNGSGKSNLVDAIHWVMGTQAPKSLRTQKMEDVIFAGTATRPALNRSEVTVVFDNASRDPAARSR